MSKNQKSFEEVKKDLIAGTYYEDLGNEYCRQIVYDAEDLKAIRTVDKLPVDRARYMTIRKMSESGGYSSVTKLFIKPAIPFEIEFNGKPHKVTVLTLMHPSPIRVENIQHDAMLTLGDPAEGNHDGLVVLIPLQGALTAGSSGDFINKIVRYMTGVLQPDPASGDFKAVDVPTGNDWKLSKMFTSAPGAAGKTYVTEPGYYVWSGYPPLQLRPDGAATRGGEKQWFLNWWIREPGVQRYSWQPNPGSVPVQYVMLSRPALVSSMDLQTIRMLPMTPTTEAFAPILKHTLSYRQAGQVGPDGTWQAACPAPSTATGAITDLFSGREGLENQCDPFAPGSFPPPNKDILVNLVIGLLTTLGVGLAIYLAVYIFTKTTQGRWLAHQATLAGNQLSQSFVSDKRKQIPPDTRFAPEVAEAEDKAMGESKAKELESKVFPNAEARLAAKSGTNPVNLDAAKKEADLIEKARLEAEAKAKADADLIETARVEAEAEAEAKAKREADLIETARVEAEAAATKAKAEADAKAKEDEAKIFPNAEGRLAPPSEVKTPISRRRAESAAGTGLLTADELKVKDDVEAAVKDPSRTPEQEAQMKKTLEEFKAAVKQGEEAKAKAEAEAKAKADADAAKEEAEKAKEEAKRAEQAAVAAEAVAEKPKPKRGTFATTVPAPNVIAQKAKAADEARKAAEAAKAAEAKAQADAKQAADDAADIKRRAEEAAASASRAAERQMAKLKKDEDLLARAEAERKKQADEYAAKQKEEEAAKFRPTSGRATAAPPAPVGAVPPPGAALKGRVESSSTSLMALTNAERLKGQINATLASIGKQEVFINANPPTKEHPNRIFNQRLETRLNTTLKTLDSQLTELESAVAKFPADKGLEKMGMTRFIKQTQEKEKKSLTAQNQRFEVLGKIITEGPAMKGGRRKRMKRKSTRRYVA